MKTFSNRQEFTWASQPAQGLIMKIQLQWISNLVNQSHMPGTTWQWMKMPQDREFHVVGIFWGVPGYKTLLPRREGLRVQGMRKGRGGL